MWSGVRSESKARKFLERQHWADCLPPPRRGEGQKGTRETSPGPGTNHLLVGSLHVQVGITYSPVEGGMDPQQRPPTIEPCAHRDA